MSLYMYDSLVTISIYESIQKIYDAVMTDIFAADYLNRLVCSK